MVKKILIVFGLIFFFSTASFAAQENNLPTQIQKSFEQKTIQYYPKIKADAKALMYSLAVIQLVLTFGFMAIRGELEVGGAFAQLVKTALIVGFFNMILDSPSWLKGIHTGFDTLGTSAGNVSFDKIIDHMYGMWDKIFSKASFWEPGLTLVYLLVGLVASAALILLVGEALMLYAFTIFSIYVGIFWVAFGVFDQTRPWAINAISNVVRWGAKWMMILILMSITFSLVDDALTHGTDDTTSIITLLIVSLMMVSISSGISSFVDSYFTGSGSGENNRGMQMASALMSGMAAGAAGAAGAAMGAYQGAKGASDTIAAASATGQEKSTLGKAASYFGGMASGAAKGAMHGGGNFAQNWAKTIDPNSTTSSSSSSSGKNFASAANEQKVAQSDGDVGGATKGSFAEPNVGGEINPNKS